MVDNTYAFAEYLIKQRLKLYLVSLAVIILEIKLGSSYVSSRIFCIVTGLQIRYIDERYIEKVFKLPAPNTNSMQKLKKYSYINNSHLDILSLI